MTVYPSEPEIFGYFSRHSRLNGPDSTLCVERLACRFISHSINGLDQPYAPKLAQKIMGLKGPKPVLVGWRDLTCIRGDVGLFSDSLSLQYHCKGHGVPTIGEPMAKDNYFVTVSVYDVINFRSK